MVQRGTENEEKSSAQSTEHPRSHTGLVSPANKFPLIESKGQPHKQAFSRGFGASQVISLVMALGLFSGEGGIGGGGVASLGPRRVVNLAGC